MATIPTGYFVAQKLMLERTCYFPAPFPYWKAQRGEERETGSSGNR